MNTVTIDAETATDLSTLAQQWNVPEGVALKRALVIAKDHVTADYSEKLQALRRLQSAVKFDARKAESWTSAIAAARR